jgi:hypothetical protein
LKSERLAYIGFKPSLDFVGLCEDRRHGLGMNRRDDCVGLDGPPTDCTKASQHRHADGDRRRGHPNLNEFGRCSTLGQLAHGPATIIHSEVGWHVGPPVLRGGVTARQAPVGLAGQPHG